MTLTQLLSQTVARRPDGIALRHAESEVTWDDVGARVAGLAAHLAGFGIDKGDRVAVWLPNGTSYFLAIFAIARLGAVTVHVNTRYGPKEIGDLLQRSGAIMLLTCQHFGSIDLLPILTAVEPSENSMLTNILFIGQAPDEFPGCAVSSVPRRLEGDVPDMSEPGLPCLIFTSSGTTSQPKLVLHNQASIAEHACDVAERLKFAEEGAGLLAVVPFCGTFGNVAAMAATASGACIVVQDVFDAAAASDLVRRHAVTHLFGDDRMIGQMADAAGKKRLDSVRMAMVAAFHPDAEESIDKARAAGLKPHGIYGSSEAQAIFAVSANAEDCAATVVPVSRHARFRFDDHARGEGELRLSGPSLFTCYHGDPDRSEASRDSAGYFRTGDFAVGDEHGFVFRSRIDDVLRLGGFLVNPLEIEHFLQGLPGVAEAQVVAVQNGSRSQPFAFVLPDGAGLFDEAAVIASCRSELARYKVPVRAVAVAEFPTTTGPNGVKIQRQRLREWAQDIVQSTASTAS